MMFEALGMSSLIFGVIFLILIVILLTKPKNCKRDFMKEEKDLKKIKDQINGYEEAW